MDVPEEGDSGALRAVPVAETTTFEEASVLEEALRDKGIEVFVREMQDTGALPGFMLSQAQQMSFRRRLLVPPGDAPVAAGIVREAVREMRRVAVLNAFDEKELEKTLTSPWDENELLQMAKLRATDAALKREALSGQVADWLADQVDEVKIARRLAVAGLSFSEARQLVMRALREQNEAFQEARKRRLETGGILVVSGVVLLGAAGILILVCLLSGKPLPLLRLATLPIFVGSLLCCTGVVIRKTVSRDPAHELLVFVDETGSVGEPSCAAPNGSQ